MVGAGAVLGLVVWGGAGGTGCSAHWSRVALNASTAVGSGASVVVSSVGGGADTALEGGLAASLAMAKTLASLALGGVGGGGVGEFEAASTAEDIDHRHAENDRCSWEGDQYCAQSLLGDDFGASELVGWSSVGKPIAAVAFFRHFRRLFLGVRGADVGRYAVNDVRGPAAVGVDAVQQDVPRVEGQVSVVGEGRAGVGRDVGGGFKRNGALFGPPGGEEVEVVVGDGIVYSVRNLVLGDLLMTGPSFMMISSRVIFRYSRVKQGGSFPFPPLHLGEFFVVGRWAVGAGGPSV